MKTVFTNSMCAHVWAQQSQPTGRSNNLSFSYDTLYSYGTPIARFVKGTQGRVAVLFTTEWYSHTSKCHESEARSAVRGQVTFDVCHVNANPKTIIADYRERIVVLAKRVKRARQNAQWLLASLTALVEKANDYAEFNGLKTRFSVPSDFDLAKEMERARRVQEKERERLAKQREEAERRAAEYKEKQREQLAAWLRGDDVDYPGSWIEYGNDRMRVKGDIIQTSRGAEVPLEHALRVLPLIRSGRAYQHNVHSIHIGQFRIDSIDEQGNVLAGCHEFKREEIERIAAQLGR